MPVVQAAGQPPAQLMVCKAVQEGCVYASRAHLDGHLRDGSGVVVTARHVAGAQH